MTKSHFRIGYVLKTSGIEGEIVLKADNYPIEKIHKEEPLFIKIDGILVPFYIRHFQIKSSVTAIIQLEDINTQEKARDYVGLEAWVLTHQSNFKKSISWIGYKVLDEEYHIIGEIVDFSDVDMNPLITVDIAGSGKTLIPVNEELLIEENHKKRFIRIIIPEGLFDL